MVALKLSSLQARKKTGVRPLNIRRDISAVTALLELVFRQHIGSAGRNALAPSFGAGLWWPGKKTAVPGFVYEHEGKVVGSISLLQGQRPGRYLVANVAVHPDFRRRGIARQLMQAARTYIAGRGGEKIVLQVEEGNQGAINLYRSLGYQAIGTTNTWQLHFHHLRPLAAPGPVSPRRPDHYPHFEIRPLRRSEAEEAFRLDTAAFPPALSWPEPISPAAYQPGLFERISNFLIGRQEEVWVAVDARQKIIGLGKLESEWGRPHQIKIRIGAPDLPDLDRLLLAKLLRRLKYLSRKPILIDHRKPDIELENLLLEAGFDRKRTLVTMACSLNGQADRRE